MIGLDGDGYDLEEIDMLLDNLYVVIPAFLFFMYIITASTMSPMLFLGMMLLLALFIYDIQHSHFLIGVIETWR